MAFLSEYRVWGTTMLLTTPIQFSLWGPCLTLPQLDEAEPRCGSSRVHMHLLRILSQKVVEMPKWRASLR